MASVQMQGGKMTTAAFSGSQGLGHDLRLSEKLAQVQADLEEERRRRVEAEEKLLTTTIN